METYRIRYRVGGYTNYRWETTLAYRNLREALEALAANLLAGYPSYLVTR